MIQNIGLVVFAVVVAGNIGGLTLDAVLATHDLPTITEIARRNQWIAALIILFNATGVLGLMLHFSNGDLK